MLLDSGVRAEHVFAAAAWHKSSSLAAIKLNRAAFKGIVSPDWKGLQMISLDRFEV
jgi:hypothetical protein